MEMFVHRPKGICSKEMRFEMNGDIVRNVTIIGGCAGNLLDISRIMKDEKTSEVLDASRGIRCRAKPTSCPSQTAEALSEYARKPGQAGPLCLWYRAAKA